MVAIEVRNQVKRWYVAWEPDKGIWFTRYEFEAKFFLEETEALAFMRAMKLNPTIFHLLTGMS